MSKQQKTSKNSATSGANKPRGPSVPSVEKLVDKISESHAFENVKALLADLYESEERVFTPKDFDGLKAKIPTNAAKDAFWIKVRDILLKAVDPSLAQSVAAKNAEREQQKKVDALERKRNGNGVTILGIMAKMAETEKKVFPVEGLSVGLSKFLNKKMGITLKSEDVVTAYNKKLEVGEKRSTKKRSRGEQNDVEEHDTDQAHHQENDGDEDEEEQQHSEDSGNNEEDQDDDEEVNA